MTISIFAMFYKHLSSICPFSTSFWVRLRVRVCNTTGATSEAGFLGTRVHLRFQMSLGFVLFMLLNYMSRFLVSRCDVRCDFRIKQYLIRLYSHVFDRGYVPLVVNTSRSFPRSWLLTGFVTRLTRWVSLVEQELFTLPELWSSPLVFSGVL